MCPSFDVRQGLFPAYGSADWSYASSVLHKPHPSATIPALLSLKWRENLKRLVKSSECRAHLDFYTLRPPTLSERCPAHTWSRATLPQLIFIIFPKLNFTETKLKVFSALDRFIYSSLKPHN